MLRRSATHTESLWASNLAFRVRWLACPAWPLRRNNLKRELLALPQLLAVLLAAPLQRWLTRWLLAASSQHVSQQRRHTCSLIILSLYLCSPPQQTHTHNHFTALLDFVQDYLDEPAPERYNQEGKTHLDLLEQEIVSGSSIKWAICKSAPWPRHINKWKERSGAILLAIYRQQCRHT